MPLFRYEARDRAGEIRRGVMDAASEQAVRDRLQGMGFQPIGIAPPPGAARSSAPAAVKSSKQQASGASQVRPFLTSSLPLQDQVVFWRQVAELSRAGFAPYDMFVTVAARTRNSRMRRAAADVASRVKQGSSVADALAASGDVFGTDYRMAIFAGEQGGFAADVYNDIAQDLETEQRLRTRMAWVRWLFYILTAGAIIGFHAMFFVTNAFSSIAQFDNMDVQGQGDDMAAAQAAGLAYLKEVVRDWLRALITRVIPLILFIFIGIPWILQWVERGPLRPLADRITFYIPLMHRLKVLMSLRRFFRILRRLVQAGVPPVQGWDAAAEAVGHYAISSKLLDGRTALLQGQGYGGALETAGVGGYGDVQLLMTADQTGRVPEALSTLEGDYTNRAGTAYMIARMAGIGVLMIAYAVLVIGGFTRLGLWYRGLLQEVLGWME